MLYNQTDKRYCKLIGAAHDTRRRAEKWFCGVPESKTIGLEKKVEISKSILENSIDISPFNAH